MSPSERSLFVFGIYLLGLGAVLVVAPNLLLVLFGVPETREAWIRIVGMLVLFLGVYDIVAARHHLAPFIRASVYLRGSVIVFFLVFVLLGMAAPVLLLFGLVDLASAAWTALALRRERAS